MPAKFASCRILPGRMLRLPIPLLRKLGVSKKRQIELDIIDGQMIISRPRSAQAKRVARLKARISAHRSLSG